MVFALQVTPQLFTGPLSTEYPLSVRLGGMRMRMRNGRGRRSLVFKGPEKPEPEPLPFIRVTPLFLQLMERNSQGSSFVF